MAVYVDLHEHGGAEQPALVEQGAHGFVVTHAGDFAAEPVVEVLEGLRHLAHAMVLGPLHHDGEPGMLLEDPAVVVLVVVLHLRHHARHAFVRLEHEPVAQRPHVIELHVLVDGVGALVDAGVQRGEQQADGRQSLLAVDHLEIHDVGLRVNLALDNDD